jgi:hypothetical protein
MKASERLQLRQAVKLKTNVLREKRSRLMAMVLSVHRRLQKGRTLLVFCVDNSCHRALAVARKEVHEGTSSLRQAFNAPRKSWRSSDDQGGK